MFTVHGTGNYSHCICNTYINVCLQCLEQVITSIIMEFVQCTVCTVSVHLHSGVARVFAARVGP